MGVKPLNSGVETCFAPSASRPEGAGMQTEPHLKSRFLGAILKRAANHKRMCGWGTASPLTLSVDWNCLAGTVSQSA